VPVWPTEDWGREYMARLNESHAYASAAKDWEGAVVYHFQAEPSWGLTADLYGYFDLWHGTCRDTRFVSADEADGAEFTISAPYSVWKQIVLGELDPVTALVKRKLKLKGNLPKALRYTKATRALAVVAGEVPDTEFLDELPPERVRELADAGLPFAVPA
jgi:putative sterol carrier protein